jgi:LysM repeat protein
MNLKLSECNFLRVTEGMTREEIEKTYSVPVIGNLYAGKIIPIVGGYSVYEAEVGDSYKKLADKFGVSEGELKQINGDKVLYPTCKLFVPKDI